MNETKQVHDRWLPWVPYPEGTVVSHGGMLYRCLQTHTSEDTWQPDRVPSIWAKIQNHSVIPECEPGVYGWEEMSNG